MDIIFFWKSSLRNQGIPLSGKYHISFNADKNILKIKRNDQYVYEFWGRNIHDCFVIVGENGAGKTALANDIMDVVKNVKLNNEKYEACIIVFEKQDTRELFIYHSPKIQNIKIQAENIRFKIGSDFWVKNYEVAYFHNALNENDYLAEKRCGFDFSIGNLIKRYAERTVGMHYDSLEKDKIINFYEQNDYKIICFLYEYALQNDLKIPFPRPQYIDIQIIDTSYNEEYIIEQLRTFNYSAKRFSRFISLGLKNIITIYGNTWINNTIRSLLLNCMKEFCVPKIASRDETHESAEQFLNACDVLMHTEKMKKISIYECVNMIIQKLRENFNTDIIYVDIVEEFICWLKENEKRIREVEDIFGSLRIEISEETHEFVKNLIELYSTVSTTFPFYSFYFGVSTGEYSFLSIFANLYLIKKQISEYIERKKGKTSILLIFDEADLSLHPKWQRMYMKWLTYFCERLFCESYVKIIVTTHSPILLSDFPANSILYLKKDEEELIYYQEKRPTFACNIHTLFLNSFFLEEYGTIGAFAEDKINRIAYHISEEEYDEDTEKIIEYIGEGIIKKKLQEALSLNYKMNRKKVSKKDQEIIKKTLEQLEEQRQQLEKLIVNLKRTIND